MTTATTARSAARDEDRLYGTFGSFFLTITTFGASAWVFLVGGMLPFVGDTRLGLVGFVSGLLLGSVICLLGAALPAYRYGIDSIDISAACLGYRGTLLPIGGTVLASLGWAAMLIAMIAGGMTSLLTRLHVIEATAAGGWRLSIYLGVTALCFVLLRSGSGKVLRATSLVGPGLLGIAAVCFGLMLFRIGISRLWSGNVPSSAALTQDRRIALCYALEFGVTFSVMWWPFVGGLCRLVKHRCHLVHPFMLGTLWGSGFCSMVAALGAVHAGSSDPAVWIVGLAGPVLGTVMVGLIFLMNIPTVAMLVYFASTSMRQFDAVAPVPWSRLVAMAFIPVAFGALDPDWVLAHVAGFTSYGGLMFLGLAAIALVDFHFLRHQRLDVKPLLDQARGNRYGFWGGVNWVAMLVVIASVIVYLRLYDPISLAISPLFRYAGAALPVILGSGMLYYALMRLIAMPLGRGGYRDPES